MRDIPCFYYFCAMNERLDDKALTPEEMMNEAELLRRNGRFGEAINAFRAVAESPDASEDIKRKSLASVELIQEINGFVNVDLMNP